MHHGVKSWLGEALVAPGLLILTLGQPSYGDEPGLFGRLFRFGGGSTSSTPAPPEVGTELPAPPPSGSFPPPPAPSLPAPSLPAPSASVAPAPRLIPQPRVSRPATESDPIVTQVALVRSNDGNQFATFLQVFADGTVLNSEGVHHLGPTDLKPVLDALQMGELYRLKGHCGNPATDYVEQVHVVVYERSLGRLRANSFSYSGNPQGCDHAVRHLHAALEGLQAKLSRPMPAAGAAPPASVPAGGPSAPVPPGDSTTVIPLTPSN